jgi:hypothetical protein
MLLAGPFYLLHRHETQAFQATITEERVLKELVSRLLGVDCPSTSANLIRLLQQAESH